MKALVAHPGLAATHLQVTSALHGGMGHRFSKMLMRNMSQSAEDGALGIVLGTCDPKAESRQFYGCAGPYGPAVLQPEEKAAGAEACAVVWEASLAATGAKYPF